ncbi:MAG TPA: hypothetical protein VJJ76_02845 [archaeon]|nr:hypothetical protein [archaeon]
MLRRVRRSWKIAAFWIVGALALFFGSTIAGKLERTLGTDDLGLIVAFLVAFVLFLLGGLLWISVAIAVKETSEE